MRIVNFFWKRFEPYLQIDFQNLAHNLPLFGQSFDFYLGEKFCIGYLKNGVRYPCPKNAKIRKGKQCDYCKSLDTSLPCARCTGEKCLLKERREMCKKEKFAIYLATFGDMLKVGISHEKRLKQRLVEQGCDFAAKIASVVDGMLARKIEQAIKRELGIVDRVKAQEKSEKIELAATSAGVAIKLLSLSFEKLKQSSIGKHLAERPVIFDMRNYYNLIRGRPTFLELEPGLRLRGRVVSVKGNLVVLSRFGKLYAIDGNELVGYEIIRDLK